jgi:RNA polymerase sigma factor (TIGR02999 family)
MSDVTQILSKIEAGDQQASAELLPLVYDELRKLAASRMRNEPVDHTLQATALVHEAYLRLVDADEVQRWDSRGHFFSAAAEAMRRILIDTARSRQSQKRGGGAQHELRADIADGTFIDSPDRLLEVDDALQKLELEDPDVAKFVRLRLYAGLSVEDAGQASGVSRSTAYDWWNYALTWFQVEMEAN